MIHEAHTIAKKPKITSKYEGRVNLRKKEQEEEKERKVS